MEGIGIQYIVIVYENASQLEYVWFLIVLF